MSRRPTTVRLSDRERATIELAAESRGEGWTTFIRRASMAEAIEELTGHRPQGSADRPASRRISGQEDRPEEEAAGGGR